MSTLYTLRYLISFYFLFLATIPGFSQQTVINGKITDATTNDAIPFANIYFKNTEIGTASDFEGYYELKTSIPGDSLTVQYLGYITRTKYVKKQSKQVIDFQLMPTAFELGEVVILPGENPAHRILREVWKYKKEHNIDRLDAYQYESYVKFEASIDNITDKLREKRVMRPFAYIFDSLQVAAGEDGQQILPIFMSETLSDIYYLKKPKRKKEVIKANRFIGVGFNEGSFITQFIGGTFHEYNFNNNWLQILDKNFISPIARGGLTYYKYYLIDSLFIDGRYCYEILIKPKRKEDLAFNGTIWIHDTSFALKRIVVEIDKSADLNFVDRLRIQQDLEPASENVWTPVKTRVLIDIEEPTKNTFGVLGKFYVSNTNYIFDKPKDLNFYSKKIEISGDAFDYEDGYWQNKRHEKISETEENIYAVIDSIKNFPRIKSYLSIAELIIEGYYVIDGWELGPYLLLYGNNEIEGHRFRIGFRTNERFNETLRLGGYLAYGTKDEKFKYNIQAQQFLSKKHWTKIGIQYREDVEGVGINQDLNESNTLFTFSKQIGLMDKMNNIRLARIVFQTDLFKGFTQHLTFTNRKLVPLGEKYSFEYFTDLNNNVRKSEITITELSLKARYAPKETWIINRSKRLGVGAKKAPVIIFTYTLGLKDLFESDFSYHKLSLSLSHKMKLLGLGHLVYTITATKNFTQLPYPLLYVLAGNETYIFSQRTYSLMNFFEFVADQYAELKYIYHFEGLLLNKIPLVKKLNWRTVTTGNLVFGSLNDKNNVYNKITNPEGILPEFDVNGNNLTSFKTLKPSKPYVELSYGVENIFKFLRIDFFHRLTYRYSDSAKFGIKVSAFFTF